METYAVIVAFDQYDDPEIMVDGAVAKALCLREWLIKRHRVEEGHIFMMLSPKPGQKLPAEVAREIRKWVPDASNSWSDNLQRLLREPVRVSGGPGRGKRLYVYYAGHGVDTQPSLGETSAIVLPNFNKDNFQSRTLSWASIFAYYNDSRLLEQFFIIDSCRTIPFPDLKATAGQMNGKDNPNDGVEISRYKFWATAPGKKSNYTQGWWSDVLFDGFNGKGKAKRWNAFSQHYEVRVETVDEYLTEEYRARMEKKGLSPTDPDYQNPVFSIKRGGLNTDSNPLVVDFQITEFDPISLEVRLELDPPPKANEPVVVTAVDHEINQRLEPVVGTTGIMTAKLPPREYTLLVNSPNYVLRSHYLPVLLYEKLPQPVPLELVAKTPTAAAPAVANRRQAPT